MPAVKTKAAVAAKKAAPAAGLAPQDAHLVRRRAVSPSPIVSESRLGRSRVELRMRVNPLHALSRPRAHLGRPSCRATGPLRRSGSSLARSAVPQWQRQLEGVARRVAPRRPRAIVQLSRFRVGGGPRRGRLPRTRGCSQDTDCLSACAGPHPPIRRIRNSGAAESCRQADSSAAETPAPPKLRRR